MTEFRNHVLEFTALLLFVVLVLIVLSLPNDDTPQETRETTTKPYTTSLNEDYIIREFNEEDISLATHLFETGDCEGLSEEEYISLSDYCRLQKAVNSNDYEECTKITEKFLRDTCYEYLISLSKQESNSSE